MHSQVKSDHIDQYGFVWLFRLQNIKKNVKFHMEESSDLTEITERDKTAVFPHTLRFGI